MKNTAIEVTGLSKKFSFPVKEKGSGWLKNLLAPSKKEIVAVDNISFSINKGEKLAFIGPNGAGKSTTIKMLTGILYPSSGKMKVLGLDPSLERKKLAYQIGTVFGQRSQLLPNLPLTDSMELFGVMYDLTDAQIKKRMGELVEIFNLGAFVNQPVRKLSLGQRMRAEVAVSLIHKPKIIFLDEPTIGLDVVAKKNLRDLLLKVNKEEGTTIFLTSHDVGDIESLCDRTMIVNFGKLVLDLPTKELSKNLANEKIVDLMAKNSFETFPKLPVGIKYVKKSKDKITVLVSMKKLTVSAALKQLLEIFEVEDVDVYETDLESIIRKIYESNTPGK